MLAVENATSSKQIDGTCITALLMALAAVTTSCAAADDEDTSTLARTPHRVSVQEPDAPMPTNGLVFLRVEGEVELVDIDVTVDGVAASVTSFFCLDDFACSGANDAACISQRCLVTARPAQALTPGQPIGVAASPAAGDIVTVQLAVGELDDTAAPVVQPPELVRRANADAVVLAPGSFEVKFGGVTDALDANGSPSETPAIAAIGIALVRDGEEPALLLRTVIENDALVVALPPADNGAPVCIVQQAVDQAGNIGTSEPRCFSAHDDDEGEPGGCGSTSARSSSAGRVLTSSVALLGASSFVRARRRRGRPLR